MVWKWVGAPGKWLWEVVRTYCWEHMITLVKKSHLLTVTYCLSLLMDPIIWLLAIVHIRKQNISLNGKKKKNKNLKKYILSLCQFPFWEWRVKWHVFFKKHTIIFFSITLERKRQPYSYFPLFLRILSFI